MELILNQHKKYFSDIPNNKSHTHMLNNKDDMYNVCGFCNSISAVGVLLRKTLGLGPMNICLSYNGSWRKAMQPRGLPSPARHLLCVLTAFYQTKLLAEFTGL